MTRRRDFLRRLGATSAALALPAIARAQAAPLTRPIPATGERLPAIGMGTWITFNVGESPGARAGLKPVLERFFAAGGRLIDSSPMYASSEAVVGDLLGQLGRPGALFSATKIWTIGAWSGRQQAHLSRQLWGVAKFDLLQVHNMLDWRTHLATLRAMKERGEVRYIGITTSHGEKEDEMARVIAREPFDFVQFTYSFADRSAERRLLPLAAEHRRAVIVNRPFDGGNLFGRVAGKPLPAFAREIDCINWAQFFLKFVVSHPAVTCAIPATSNPAHMDENMGALSGRLPDASERARMARTLADLA